VADVGLGVTACDEIVAVTEQVCRGQYAAYTYAKQTLGCREFPMLAATCQAAAHTVTHAIVDFSDNADLALDDREPHMVKYDVTKKERQKLDMHTDKSEWTFLIALSNGYVSHVRSLQIILVGHRCVEMEWSGVEWWSGTEWNGMECSEKYGLCPRGGVVKRERSIEIGCVIG
jgi:hypothetical protein